MAATVDSRTMTTTTTTATTKTKGGDVGAMTEIPLQTTPALQPVEAGVTAVDGRSDVEGCDEENATLTNGFHGHATVTETTTTTSSATLQSLPQLREFLLQHLPPEMVEFLLSWLERRVLPFVTPARLLTGGLILVAAFCTPWVRRNTLMPLLRWTWSMVMRIVGTAIGVAVGLGFASHVYETFERLYDFDAEQEEGEGEEAGEEVDGEDVGGSPDKAQKQGMRSRLASVARRGVGAAAARGKRFVSLGVRKPSQLSNSSQLGGSSPHRGRGMERKEEAVDDSYAALMASAGYDLPKRSATGKLRGQIIRGAAAAEAPGAASSEKSMYQFTEYGDGGEDEDGNPRSKGSQVMRRMWPNLPNEVNDELGVFIDYIMRDYVASWYSMVDISVHYNPPPASPNDGEGDDTNETSVGGGVGEEEPSLGKAVVPENVGATTASPKKASTMILSTMMARPAPFVEVLYDTLGCVLGTISTFAAENVNVAELVLLKVVRVISLNIKTYRELRKVALEKKQLRLQAANPSSASAAVRARLKRGIEAGLRAQPSAPNVTLPSPPSSGNVGQRAQSVSAITASPSASFTAVASATSVAAQQFASSASESMTMATEQMTAATSQVANATSQMFSSATAATTAAMAEATTATLGTLTVANPLSRSLSNIVTASPKAENDVALDSRRHGGLVTSPSTATSPFAGATSPQRNASDKSLLALESTEPPHVVTKEEDGDNNGDEEEEEDEVSEIAMIREFLLAGKLHKAVTFGLDVPTLLFADPTGRDCPPPEDWKEESPINASGRKDVSQPPSWSDEDVVLHNRLFGANRRLLYECELDYNRVVAHRMCRILLPRTDFGSPVVRSMTVEMLASSVLLPTMDTFVPPSINQMIVDGMEAAAAATEETEEGGDVGAAARRVSTNPEEEKALEVAATAAVAEMTPDEDEEDHDQHHHEEREAVEREKQEETAPEKGEEDSQSSTSPPEDKSPPPHDTSNNNAETSNDNAVLEDSGFARSESAVSALLADVSDEDKAPENDAEADCEKVETTNDATTQTVTDALEALESEQPPEPITSDDEMAGIDGDVDVPSDDDLGHDVFDEEVMEMGEGDAVSQEEAEVDHADGDKQAVNKSVAGAVDQIFTLVTMSLMELQSFFDFDDARMARERNDEVDVDWDDRRCREAVNQLVLVVEAAILHGLRDRSVPQMPPPPLSNEGAAPPPPPPDAPSLSMVLMEMTSDLESFRQKVEEAEEEMEGNPEPEAADDTEEKMVDPTTLGPTEVRTMRTLIAAWLHTGKVYSTLNLILRATRTKVLNDFYCRYAFIRDPDNASGFARQLRAVEGVEILVDAMAILSKRPLDLSKFGMDGDTSREEDDDDSDDAPSARSATDSPASPRGFFPNPASAIMGATKGGNLLGRAFDKNRQQHESATTPQRKGLRIGGAIRQQHTDLQKVTGNFAGNMKAGFQNNRQRLSRLVGGANNDGGTPNLKAPSSNQQSLTNPAAPDGGDVDGGEEDISGPIGAHLEFSRNQAFAASLRLERERRLESWAKVTEAASATATTTTTSDGKQQQQQQQLEMVCRTRGSTEQDVLLHKEMHHLSRWFYTGTNVLCLRSSAAKSAEGDSNGGSEDAKKPSTLLIMETVCNRRRMEVPDDDSSFLLRAQPRQLNPVGVHRDQRNHDNSYKSFAAYYEEPVIHPRTKKYHGGKCHRRCVLKYFPSNRTASASLVQESRRLDYRKGRTEIVPGDFKAHEVRLGFAANSGAVLTEEFQNERHSCNKAAQRTGGAGGAGSILSSPVMDMTDFNSVPRTGKAIDFVYRMSLFEKPCIELAGKKFIVQDSSITGPHRADASSLEISDAALSLALLMYGPENVPMDDSGTGFQIVTGPDGAPMVLMKLGGGEKDGGGGDSRQTRVEVRPYRPSFIRAALYVTSARQEAQLQCLMSCVRTSTARNATKAKTEALLQPTMCLLDYANSAKREKQSILLRDLKLGINHIDREQLRRNCILLPRYPTLLRGLKVLVEAAVPVRSVPGAEAMGPPGMILFRIRCVAISEVLEITEEFSGHGDIQFVREEWVVYRPFRDFTILHKHLKTQVAATEASAGTGARIVGAATAAFTDNRHRQRKRLIPSLGQATKAGALGVTKKALEKRREILNGYITYLLGRDNLLSRSPEVLRFLGAYDPLPAELRLGSSQPQTKVVDSLGRTQMKRTVVDQELLKVGPNTKARLVASAPTATTPRALPDAANAPAATPVNGEKAMLRSGATASQSSQSKSPAPKTNRVQALQEAMKASLNSRLDKVKLAQVRTVVFDLIRYLFDIDNASFFRSRMFGALKTMSFAVTSAQEFRKTLVKMHVTYLSPEALGGYIKMGRDILWPNGVFFTSSPEKTPAEKKALAKKTREMLPQAFPDQLKTLLGQEISDDGINVLHEMLQNRVVLKSMAYMIMDLVWLEIFPELNDVLHGASALDGEDA